MDENNRDIYYANLTLVKLLSTKWAGDHPRRKTVMRVQTITMIAGLAMMGAMLYYVQSLPKEKQWVLHLSIWAAALVIYLAVRYRNKVCKPPFLRLLNARFEMSDEGIYYIYQEGLTVKTYYIADEAIEEMVYDETYHVLYLRGTATLTPENRKGVGEAEEVGEMYCLLPFDEYDADDLLAPYEERLARVNGALRARYAG